MHKLALLVTTSFLPTIVNSLTSILRAYAANRHPPNFASSHSPVSNGHMLLSNLGNGAKPNETFQSDIVIRVIDSNTLKLKRRGLVTLAYVKTPTAGSFQFPECLTYSPSYKLKQLLPPNKPVKVQTADYGPNGEPRVLLLVEDSELLVNRELVRTGFARCRKPSKSQVKPDALQEELALLEEQAQRQSLGIFKKCVTDTDFVTAEFEEIDLTVETIYGIDGGKPVTRDRTAERHSEVPSNPGDVKGCSDFEFYEDALRWYETYFPWYGDVAKLDSDHDGVPCQGLPHTPAQDRYRMKKPVVKSMT